MIIRFLKYLIGIFILFSLQNNLYAQDQIQKRNGELISARVLTLKGEMVTYVRTDDPEFTVISVSKKELKQIRLEDGTVYNFDKRIRRNYVAFSLGPCIPLGDLRKKNLQEAKGVPGYMNVGFSPKIDLGIYIKKNFGFCFQWSVFNMGIDNASIEQDLQKGGSGDVKVFFMDKNDTKITKYNSFVNVGLGAFYSISKNKHTLDFKLVRGVIKLDKQSAHEHHVLNPDDPTTRTDVVRGYDTKAQGFWSSGMAYRYRIGKNISARATLDFTGLSMIKKYDVTITGQSAATTDANSNTTDFQKFAVLSIGVGMAFHF